MLEDHDPSGGHTQQQIEVAVPVDIAEGGLGAFDAVGEEQALLAVQRAVVDALPIVHHALGTLGRGRGDAQQAPPGDAHGKTQDGARGGPGEPADDTGAEAR